MNIHSINKNHQRFANSSIKIGLFYENRLVSICYFNTNIKDKIDILEESFNIVDSFKEGSEHILVLDPKDFSIK
jgi:hypothetical protein